jgi:hypothetical protein
MDKNIKHLIFKTKAFGGEHIPSTLVLATKEQPAKTNLSLAGKFICPKPVSKNNIKCTL